MEGQIFIVIDYRIVFLFFLITPSLGTSTILFYLVHINNLKKLYLYIIFIAMFSQFNW